MFVLSVLFGCWKLLSLAFSSRKLHQIKLCLQNIEFLPMLALACDFSAAAGFGFAAAGTEEAALGGANEVR